MPQPSPTPQQPETMETIPAPDPDLARRAVACKRWRMMPGMLLRTVEGMTIRVAGVYYTQLHPWIAEHGVPDFSDPATMGCLLALVREAYKAPRAMVRFSADSKSYHVFDCDAGGCGQVRLRRDRLATEADALVDALENAP